MILYVKNPRFGKSTFTCCGIRFDESTVVFGDKFDVFANPNTFPGKIPRLKVASIDELTSSQRDSLDGFRKDFKPDAPKHLGVITSMNFENVYSDGGVRIKREGSNKSYKAPTPDPSIDDPVEIKEFKDEENIRKKENDILSENDKKIIEQKDFIEKDEPEYVHLLSDYSDDDLIGLFPGVTKKNISKLKKNIKTIEELTDVSKVKLSIAGIRANFHDRIRETACKFIEVEDEDE